MVRANHVFGFVHTLSSEDRRGEAIPPQHAAPSVLLGGDVLVYKAHWWLRDEHEKPSVTRRKL